MADRDPSPSHVPSARPPKKKTAHSSSPPRVNLSVQDRRHQARLLNETQRRKDQLFGLTTDDVAVRLHRYTVEPTAVMDDTRGGCTAAGKKPASAAAAGSRSELRATTVNFSTTATASASAAASTSRVAEPGIVEAAAASGGGTANSRWRAQYAHQLQHKKLATDLRSPLTSATGASAFPRLRDNGSNGKDEEEEGDSDSEPLPLPPSNYEEWMAVGCPTGSWAALLQEEVYAPVAAERAMLMAKYDPKGRPSPPPPAATS